MRILFLGDIMGKTGRDAVLQSIKRLRSKYKLDLVVVNGENASHGFGISRANAEEFLNNGIDIITTGNHAYDKEDIIDAMRHNPRILRPLNFNKNMPGRGFYKGTMEDGRQFLIINIQGRLFMELSNDPISALDEIIGAGTPVKQGYDMIFIDIHAEANSEKYAIAHYCDGRVSAIVGSHTHIPTADAHIMANGTGFQCDAGMCGDYDSVIGMKKETSLGRFRHELPKPKLEPASGEATICGTIIETDEMTGLCKSIKPLRIGGILENTKND